MRKILYFLFLYNVLPITLLFLFLSLLGYNQTQRKIKRIVPLFSFASLSFPLLLSEKSSLSKFHF